ncbi:Hsp70 family protein [Nocardia blacklockiae]|uniref:Hsp70 family protein n=1 Tax=Nocardia blacklockiae TaxID=480036 RepID=UPI0018934B55|nr:Hsp70 family protein [Nocardia blacklockiae]MBF6172263.1 Hsp70 family protein [Nocardia blacklockiae]
MSIGTVNSVWAVASERDRPAVRVRRTAVTFDSAGGPRMGSLPRFAPVVTDFADLTRHVEPVIVGGRIWTQADLVAAVVACLLDADEPAAGPVATYPASYTERQLSPLRHALEKAGAADVTLMPEAVAAVEWLDAEHGVSENGITLVYDLGGNTLDVAVVRTEGDRDKRGVLGKPVRSHEYGGRPLGTVLARYARALAPGVPTPVSKVVPVDDTSRLRTWTVRNSLRLVRKCVYGAGLTLGEIDRVLLVGGAARPPEVARVLSELGRPVVMSQDPAHTAAVGAALAAARAADPGTNLGRYARGAAVISSAAVASAVAMSAASMLGGGPIGTDGPALEFAPALAGPAQGARGQFRDVRLFESLESAPGLPAGADGLLSPSSLARPKIAVGQAVAAVAGSAAAVERAVRVHGPGTHCDPVDRRTLSTYANPARFTNPLPFSTSAASVGGIPSVSLPGSWGSSPSGTASPNPDIGPAPSMRLPGGSLSRPTDGASGTGTGWADGSPSGTPISGSLGGSPGTGTAGGVSGGSGGVSAWPGTGGTGTGTGTAGGTGSGSGASTGGVGGTGTGVGAGTGTAVGAGSGTGAGAGGTGTGGSPGVGGSTQGSGTDSGASASSGTASGGSTSGGTGSGGSASSGAGSGGSASGGTGSGGSASGGSGSGGNASGGTTSGGNSSTAGSAGGSGGSGASSAGDHSGGSGGSSGASSSGRGSSSAGTSSGGGTSGGTSKADAGGSKGASGSGGSSGGSGGGSHGGSSGGGGGSRR